MADRVSVPALGPVLTDWMHEMGERSNIRIIEADGGSFYFYTHWGTDRDTKRAVARALRDLPGRWSDESFLARGVFCRLVEGHEMSVTGFGISTWAAADAGHPLVTVNVREQKVTFGEDGETRPFGDFVELVLGVKP